MQNKNNKKSKLESRYQDALRLYLRSYRVDKEITQQDLADELGVSKSLIAKFESKEAAEPTTPVSSLMQLQTIADLRGLAVDSFCSILLGKRNEEGEEGGSFAKDIAADIQALENTVQVDLKMILKEPSKLSTSIKTLVNVVNASPIRSELYSLIKNLNETQVENILVLFKSFSVGNNQ